MSDEKTEAPTEQRRSEARRKGQGIGRSHELAQVMTLVAGLLMLSSTVPDAVRRIGESVTAVVNQVADGPSLDPAIMVPAVGDGGSLVLQLVVPLSVAVMIAGIGGSVASGGFVLSVGAVRVDFNRMNPLQGLKRMVDKTVLSRLGISVAKLVILIGVSWQVISSRIPDLVAADRSTGEIAARAMSAIFELGVTIAVLLSAVALADWIIERRRATGSLRMTREEVKQEYRQQEGDPLIRAQRRAKARQMAFSRMMSDIAKADVVVVNPIRLAVALRYDPNTMRAPMIVGKGQRLVAARIRELARKHNIPIIEDVPLARALFPKPVGSEVPAHLYKAVARILVLVARLRAGNARPVSRRRPVATVNRIPSWLGGPAR